MYHSHVFVLLQGGKYNQLVGTIIIKNKIKNNLMGMGVFLNFKQIKMKTSPNKANGYKLIHQ
jgi:hypothetical protein